MSGVLAAEDHPDQRRPGWQPRIEGISRQRIDRHQRHLQAHRNVHDRSIDAHDCERLLDRAGDKLRGIEFDHCPYPAARDGISQPRRLGTGLRTAQDADGNVRPGVGQGSCQRQRPVEAEALVCTAGIGIEQHPHTTVINRPLWQRHDVAPVDPASTQVGQDPGETLGYRQLRSGATQLAVDATQRVIQRVDPDRLQQADEQQLRRLDTFDQVHKGIHGAEFPRQGHKSPERGLCLYRDDSLDAEIDAVQIHQFRHRQHRDTCPQLACLAEEERRDDGIAQLGIPARNHDVQGLAHLAPGQAAVGDNAQQPAGKVLAGA